MTHSTRRLAQGTLILVLTCSGCARQPVVPMVTEVRRVQSVTVEKFEGDTQGEITQAFIQALAGSGLKIVDRQKGPDAILSGSVNNFKSARKLMVFLGPTKTLSNGQMITLSNPVVTLTGSQVIPQTQGSPHIIAESAVVGLSVRLAEVPSGKLLWADEFSYESLDPQDARRATVGTVARALLRVVPQLSGRQVNKD